MVVVDLFMMLLLLHCYQNVNAFCCNYGKTQATHGKSCADIVRMAPDCKGKSGLFWIENSNGSAVEVYCNMDSLGGGWERVAYYDSKVSGAVCPGNMAEYALGPHKLCTNNGTNITGAQYQPMVRSYSEVMGLVTGFVSGDGDAFKPSGSSVKDLNGVYMEGISVTINDSTDSLKHIFSIGVSGTTDVQQPTNCYLYSGDIASPPYSLGKDYLCYLLLNLQYMSLHGVFTATMATFGDRDSGACVFVSTACRSPGRYFVKQLPNNFLSADSSIVVRIVSQGTNVVAMNFVDIYVR